MERNEKKCLIIGSDSSVGQAIGFCFRENGWDVYGTTRRQDVHFVNKLLYVDVNCKQVMIDFEKNLPKIDVAIFSIGLLPGKNFFDYSNEEVELVFKSNLIAPLLILKSLINVMKDGGSVLFISSISGSAGSFDEFYSSSKAALHGLVKSLAKKNKKGIRFNCLAPGLIEGSSMYQTFTHEEINRHRLETPTNSLIHLDEMAKVCFDLSQPHWQALNGQVININGGRYV